MKQKSAPKSFLKKISLQKSEVPKFLGGGGGGSDQVLKIPKLKQHFFQERPLQTPIQMSDTH